MNAITFDEKDRSASISYEELASTMELGNGDGELPKQCPVQPGQLIKNIVDAIQTYTKLDPVVEKIVIREPYCQVDRKRLKENQPLRFEDYAIKRMVGKVTIPMEAFAGTKDHMKPSICITYVYTDSVKGVQIGFGENVNVCDNMTIFGGYQFSTYGNSKVPFNDGLQLLNHWLQNMESVHNKHIDVITKLMKVKVAKAGFQRIIGSLFEKAVRFNAGDKGVTAPLSQTQVGEMVRMGIPVLKEAELLNGWEILNWGTQTLKPNNSDMVSLLSDTANFNTYMLEEFKIDKAELAI